MRHRGGHYVSFGSVSGAGSTAIGNWSGPNQLWVADITYVAIIKGSAYVAVILDAWSRWAVGYAIRSAARSTSFHTAVLLGLEDLIEIGTVSEIRAAVGDKEGQSP